MKPPIALAQDHEEILQRGGDLWSALQGARLFVTGGTGFIGTWMLESLAWINERKSLGLEAVVLTRDPGGFQAREPWIASRPYFRFLPGDVRRIPKVEGAFSHLIHGATAASAKLNLENPFEMLDTIVQGTRSALELALEKQIPLFLNLSSGGVYGRQPADLEYLHEEHPGAPNPMEPWSCYSEAKRVSELMGMLASQHPPMQHKVARITALVGPRLPLDIHFAMGNFIGDALADRPIVIKGDGTTLRSYLYIGDLVHWLWAILLKGQSNRPYNAGSDQPVSMLEIAQLVQEVSGNRVPIEVLGQPIPGNPPNKYIPSTLRARQELGLDTWTPLNEGIARTLRWYQTSKNAKFSS